MRKHRRRQHERQSHFRRTAAFPSCVCPQAHSVPLPAPDLSLIFCARSPARHFVKAHLLDDPGLVQHIIGHVRARLSPRLPWGAPPDRPRTAPPRSAASAPASQAYVPLPPPNLLLRFSHHTHVCLLKWCNSSFVLSGPPAKRFRLCDESKCGAHIGKPFGIK